MKKNEQQPQETAAVAADAPAAQENEAAAQQPAQTEESAPDAGGEIAVADDGPIDENQDPTFVPVTVLVVATSAANNYLLLRHCLRSLQKNLRGVDAQVKVVGAERPDWLDCESWLSDAAGEFNHLNELVARALPHVETNRVILMTDRMLPSGVVRDLSEGEEAFRRQGQLPCQWEMDDHYTVKPLDMGGKPFHGALIDNGSYLIRYTVDPFYRHWMVWNAYQNGHFICLEPQNWRVNAPNLVEKLGEEAGFDLIPPGQTVTAKAHIEILEK